MILGGYLPDDPTRKVGEVVLTLTVDTSNFERVLVRTARQMLALDALREVIGLTPDQVWARFYVRGAMDPDFASPDSRDLYLRALCSIRGDRGLAARSAFLQGWVEHRATVQTERAAEVLAWHRLVGDTAISVGVAA